MFKTQNLISFRYPLRQKVAKTNEKLKRRSEYKIL